MRQIVMLQGHYSLTIREDLQKCGYVPITLSHDTTYVFNHAEYDCVHLPEGNSKK